MACPMNARSIYVFVVTVKLRGGSDENHSLGEREPLLYFSTFPWLHCFCWNVLAILSYESAWARMLKPLQ